MSDTQLYKQAGNGMSRNILDMIFTQIFKSKILTCQVTLDISNLYKALQVLFSSQSYG